MNKKKTVLAITVLMLALLGTTWSSSGLDADAGRKVATFKTTVKPDSGVKPGTTITAKSVGAPADTQYYCVLSVVSEKKGLTASNTMTLKTATSNDKGKLACKQTFRPFTAEDENGAKRHCPTTKRDRKGGFKCAVALADAATIGANSVSVGYFSAVK